MISIKGLQKHYGSVRAVDGITFEVRPGDVVGFLGPNGAGKTTTMQILTGYIPPTVGDVLLNGMDVTENPIEVKKLIGYLPENISLYEDLTVYEFLQFVGEIRGLNGKKRQAIKEAAEAC
ncbi:MAG: ATP-binding cassette domain-containing protein, partial [Nitrospirae bacterium]